ncbi:MAG TPA: conjugal transfer protein, partial [Gammaproteobacteria bacterium]|nr:conjugal transfer protein [Gammaproteobacteria bacterium]
RMAAKLHRQLIARDTSSRGAMCLPLPLPILRKSQYKTQMLYPVPFTLNAQPFGRVTIPWGAGREYPVRGEDWAYLIWRKKACCAF